MQRQRANPRNTRHYLTVLQNQKVTPNFWTSIEYLIRTESEWVKDGPLSGFQQEDDEWLLPPIHSDGSIVTSGINIFAGWPQPINTNPVAANEGYVFLDHQFIYDPQDFRNMDGSTWQVFRKNVRKFPTRCSGVLSYRSIQTQEVPEEFLAQWAEGREIYDPDTLVRFVLFGDNRKGLWVDDKLVGVNVWDTNYQFINFRYCVDNRSPFLNEYMRFLFYTDDDILRMNKMVNDGGSLGSDALYRFKCKLNPKQILEVASSRG